MLNFTKKINLDGVDALITPAFVHLDDAANVFFTRQLEYVSQQTYDYKYPALKAQQHIPFTAEGGEGSETFIYYTYNKTGMFKIISNYADDLPRTEINGKQVVVVNKVLGGAYAYNYMEIMNAQFAGMPIEARKAIATREVYEQTINRMAWFGDVDNGVVGLLNHPNVTKYSASATGTGSSRKFVDKTPAQIVADVNAWINDMIALTQGVEVPDTILLDIGTYQLLNTTPYATFSGGNMTAMTPLTVLGYLKEAHPEIATWDWVPDLANLTVLPSTGAPIAPGASTKCAVVFKSDARNLRFNVPMVFKQLPTEIRGLEYITNCLAKISGMIIQYPLSVSIIDSI